jgi:hypothetical protein
LPAYGLFISSIPTTLWNVRSFSSKTTSSNGTTLSKVSPSLILYFPKGILPSWVIMINYH